MRNCKTALVLMTLMIVSGCASTEKMSFQATSDQNAIMRDGKPSLISKKKNSILIVTPASRDIDPGVRPVFVLAMYNLSTSPLDFRVADVSVSQKLAEQLVPLPVVSYEELVSEERTRQAIAAVGVGLSAVGGAMAAANAGYGHAHTIGSATTYSRYGTFTSTGSAHTTFYDPTAAAIAQANVSAQNSAMIARVVEEGKANMAALEQTVIKDNTIMPGEWYGGQLHFAAPQSSGASSKVYAITIRLGPDTHVISVNQTNQH